MSRINRKKWQGDAFGILSRGGMFDLFDNMIKLSYRITDDEYDSFIEVATDEEMDLFVTDKPTFAQKREMIRLLNKHIDYTNDGN